MFTNNTNDLCLKSTDDGIHLEESILWFDSHHSGQLSFLSNAINRNKFSVPQVIATEETIKILDAFHIRVNSLKCQYNRPFSIGRLKMELLPSGGTLGGASLYVETGNGRILYAPYLQTQRIPTVRQMQLKRSNYLILGAHHPNPKVNFPIRKKEKERLLGLVESLQSQDKPIIILCPIVSIGQELTELFTSHGISIGVHSKIYQINKIYESCGSVLGNYSTLSSKRKCQVLLYPIPFFKDMKIPPLPTGPKIIVNDGSHDIIHENIEGFVDSVTLSLHSDGGELKEVAAAVQPEKIYFFGTYARSYAEEFKNTAPYVAALYDNDQPTLF